MNSRCRFAISVMLVLATAAPAVAVQSKFSPFGPKNPWAHSGGNKILVKELELTGRQAESLRRISGSGQDVAKSRAAVKKELSADQWRRLLQIVRQDQGGYVLFDDEVAAELKIEKAQRDRLRTADATNDAEHKKMRDFLARARFRSREAMEKYIDGYRQAANQRLLTVLTDSQRKKLKQLLGPPPAKSGA